VNASTDQAERSASHNLGRFLPQAAASNGERTALVDRSGSAWRRTAYAELERCAGRLAAELGRAGVLRGDRAVVLMRPGPLWMALIQALFRMGAVPVLIDPGMGRAGLLRCVERCRPRVFAGGTLAHLARLAAPRACASVERSFSSSGLERLASGDGESLPPVPVAPDDPAAVLFTSGSTGPAKGVLYTHGMFTAQIEALRETYAFQAGAADLACFPLFALFAPALELTSVLPAIDFSHPARCDPRAIVEPILEHRVATSFGSPAIWTRVAPWCAARGIVLEPLRKLMIAGAPVQPRLIEQCLAVLPDSADVFTPYGATEALPIANVSGRGILARHRAASEKGSGNCLGRAVRGVEVRLLRITDEPVASWRRELEVPAEAPGEICVRGPQVTREYLFDPAATSLAKIAGETSSAQDAIWHRMGDLGRFDDQGELWFLGRKAHRIETARGTVFPVCLENIFRLHERVARCALVGVGPRGAERPVLVVEAAPGLVPRNERLRAKLAADILRTGLWFPPCAQVERVLFKRHLPVDVRHNAKIDRGELKRWAEGQLR
jgi:olefin beta-lactone synthetase